MFVAQRMILPVEQIPTRITAAEAPKLCDGILVRSRCFAERNNCLYDKRNPWFLAPPLGLPVSVTTGLLEFVTSAP
jgi:hypothetical protein